ncbi:MAG TPA: glycosyltransferase [Cyclobacteriaceae bacterium]|nr:glycosyltransferase [Cyclobacteriaceae bacterium]
MIAFSLVSTVLNEADRLDLSLQDLKEQTVRPNEILITDAGSDDGTFEKLKEWALTVEIPVKIFRCEGFNVAQGRNYSISHSSFGLIVSTDFGCRFHPEWLKSITGPFQDERIFVVGGSYGADEKQINSLAARANYILTNGYQIRLNDKFIPSSRSIAYMKEVWEKLNGYPENLTHAGDDQVFGERIRASGYNVHLVKEPYVYWQRHVHWKGYARESFRYGLGDGEARLNRRNIISNILEIFLRYVFFGLLIMEMIKIVFRIAPGFELFLLIPAFFGLRSYFNSIRNWFRLRSEKYTIRVLLYSFFLIESTRISYITGYMKGIINRQVLK